MNLWRYIEPSATTTSLILRLSWHIPIAEKHRACGLMDKLEVLAENKKIILAFNFSWSSDMSEVQEGSDQTMFYWKGFFKMTGAY